VNRESAIVNAVKQKSQCHPFTIDHSRFTLLLAAHYACCFFFDLIVEPFFIVDDPGWKILVNNSPSIFLSLHFEYNTVAAIVGHIYMKQAIGTARQHAEIKFSQTVGSLNQLGEVDILKEGEIHFVQFAG
jgi:hypothetical protein